MRIGTKTDKARADLLALPAFITALDQALQNSSGLDSSSGALFLIHIDLSEPAAIGGEFRQAAWARIEDTLREAARSTDIFGAVGDEALAVFIDKIEDRDVVDERAIAFIGALSAPLSLDGTTVLARPTVGVALSPENGTSAAELVENARNAAWEARAEGGSALRFYAPTSSASANDARWIAARLPVALDAGEIVPFLQPVVDLSTWQIRGFEALARWQHPEIGLIAPDRFIGIAESSGFGRRLGITIFEQALRQFQALIEAGREPGILSVNAGWAALHHPDLLPILRRMFDSCGLPPERIELEITEDVAVGRNASEFKDLIQRLRDVGCGIVLDDFGTGFASLTHLLDLPVTGVKIDRRFTQQVDRDSRRAAIVKNIAEMAHTLDLVVVAEGIETAEQLRAVAQCGCDHGQGYLLGRPMPFAEVADWIEQFRLPPV